MRNFDFFAQPPLRRPNVDAAFAMAIASEHYGINGVMSELGSHQDRNFCLDAHGHRTLLKFSNSAFKLFELEAQSLAAATLADAGIPAPQAVAAKNGDFLMELLVEGEPIGVRMLEFVEGEALSGHGPFSPLESQRLGALAARVDKTLMPLRGEGFGQRTQWNLREGDEAIQLLVDFIPNEDRRRKVRELAQIASVALEPLRGQLRNQVIHGDLTDDNIVLTPSGDWGVIDFGDVAESWMVAELAITCASILHHNPGNPLVILEAVAAYHEEFPLTDSEIAALWPLIQLRSAILVASGEEQVAIEATNHYAAENRRQEWRAFTVAESIGIHEMQVLLQHRLSSSFDRVDELPGILIDAAGASALDFSTTSHLLGDGLWLEPDAEETIATAHAPSVTNWGEARLTRASLQSRRNTPTIPLGVEIYVKEPTRVTSPVSGNLFHVEGSTVIRSETMDIWLEGVEGTHEGEVSEGEIIGTIPVAPARMRVQLSRLRGERLPFFVSPVIASEAKKVSPDPAMLLGRIRARWRGETASAAELLARRDAHFASVQEHYYENPPRFERGWREHFIDTDAQTAIDMVNNVATVGHGHPRLVKAVADQWSLLNTNSRFHYGAVADFSSRLAELAPPGLESVFLVNSGSEAVDLGIRLATAATNRDIIVAVKEAYHGWTIGSDAVSSSIGDNPRALETRPPWVRLADAPNSYRGKHRGPNSGPAYLADFERDLRRWQDAGDAIAGFIAEPVYGNAGGVFLPDGYLKGVYGMIRDIGGICIADEVQVGYGRLGSYFWGHEQQEVTPDIITVAKAMGNGHPLGAVITSRKIAELFAAEGSMFSSAGGSPVSCVVGGTVLDIMRDEDLVQNASEVGGYLRQRLLELQSRHPIIGCVHGLGLYLGVELVRSPETLEPATEEALEICNAMLSEGCIVQPTGDYRNILKIKPPMVLTRESVEWFADALDRVLHEFAPNSS